MRRSTLATWIAVLPLVALGCETSPEPSFATLDCSTVIEDNATLPDAYTVILEAIALPASENAEHALQATESDDSRCFAKTGLLVMPGASFSITAADTSDGSVEIGWGSGASAQRFVGDGCDGGSVWMAFAGGFTVDDPSCRTFVVESGDRQRMVEIGIGAPCPGQSPPP